MTQRRAVLALMSTAALPPARAAEPLRITIPQLAPSAQQHASYFPQLLRLALEKTRASDGPFEIRHYDQAMSGPRQLAELKKDGAINLIWDGTDARREAELLPVRISLLRELNDYRVFLIRSGTEARFRAVRSLAERARRDLEQRVEDLLATERARYLDLLDSLEVSPESPELLRASARRVDDLRVAARDENLG